MILKAGKDCSLTPGFLVGLSSLLGEAAHSVIPIRQIEGLCAASAAIMESHRVRVLFIASLRPGHISAFADAKQYLFATNR